MQASGSKLQDKIEEVIGSPEGAVSFAWDTVKRHPLASLGAVAAGVGAYVLLCHLEHPAGNGKSAKSSRSSAGGSRKSRRARGRRAPRGGAANATRSSRAPRPLTSPAR